MLESFRVLRVVAVQARSLVVVPPRTSSSSPDDGTVAGLNSLRPDDALLVVADERHVDLEHVDRSSLLANHEGRRKGCDCEGGYQQRKIRRPSKRTSIAKFVFLSDDSLVRRTLESATNDGSLADSSRSNDCDDKLGCR